MKMHIKHGVVAMVAIHAVLALSAIGATLTAELAGEDVKTEAWYLANLQAAEKQNQECRENPDIQATANCANALHALGISLKGAR